MYKKLLFLLTVLSIISCETLFAQAGSGSLKGKVKDKQSGEVLPFAPIALESGGKQVTTVTSDFEGNYFIKPLPPGKYDIKISAMGYGPLIITGVVVTTDKITFQDLELSKTAVNMTGTTIIGYKVPLIDKDNTTVQTTITSEEISKMAGRDVGSIALTAGGFTSRDGGLDNLRGARSEGTAIYIDGVKQSGSGALPKAAIDQVTVIAGGIPAQYGDATGVVNVTLKGASREYHAGGEFVTTQFIEPYSNNLLSFNVQGPLIKGKDSTQTTALLGFFIAGEISYNKKQTIGALDEYKLKDDVYDNLYENPICQSGEGYNTKYKAEYLRMSDLEKVKVFTEPESHNFNVIGKFDVRTTKNTNLTFGANIVYNNGLSYFSGAYGRGGELLNPSHLMQGIGETGRFYVKFFQKFPTENEKATVQNAFYSISASYTKYHSISQDPEHKDDLFNYGYVGKFTTYKEKVYKAGNEPILGYKNVMLFQGWADTLYSFEPGTANPDLANYTSHYYELFNPSSGAYSCYDTVNNGTLVNGEMPGYVYGMWANRGNIYNAYAKYNESKIGIDIMGSADIKKHAVQIGFQYEQYTGNYFGTNPAGLWTLINPFSGLVNSHIKELDKDNPLPVYDAYGVFQDTVNYNRLCGSGQYYFDYNLRKKLGLAVDGTDWIDVGTLAPETFSLDMFSADNLILDGGGAYVTYFGYDYKGDKLKHRPTLDDFFTDKDEFGNYKREIASNQPIYMAGYIMDKFAFDDLIFNIGLRVDRLDLNQYVPKDPFLLYEAKTAGEVKNLGEHPANISDDYVVYVNDINNPTTIKGYRHEYTWYNAQGIEIQDPSAIESGGSICPYLVDPDQSEISSSAFKDYEPQVTYMPRISFSFPISDDALFFAHYDVLTNRPTNAQISLTEYLYLNEYHNTGVITNPNLRPQKTVDYELGFEQKLTNRSALKFSAYYREMRDMIQLYRYYDAYPATYISYNNIDFGTVKGLNVSYDLRRMGNVSMRGVYTLQFADATGSNATTSGGLIAAGYPNLRTVFPTDYDQRHAITITTDYRYENGKNYNGPKLNIRKKGSDKVKVIRLLENTGASFQVYTSSGTPYTRRDIVDNTVIGSVNGSRYPWIYRINARFDRDIYLQSKGKDESKKKDIYLNVYFEVFNLLNTKNILAVYATTGNPDDDGYLSAAQNQAAIQVQTDEISYRQLYALAINSPGNYSAPRSMRLGVQFNF